MSYPWEQTAGNQGFSLTGFSTGGLGCRIHRSMSAMGTGKRLHSLAALTHTHTHIPPSCPRSLGTSWVLFQGCGANNRETKTKQKQNSNKQPPPPHNITKLLLLSVSQLSVQEWDTCVLTEYPPCGLLGQVPLDPVPPKNHIGGEEDPHPNQLSIIPPLRLVFLVLFFLLPAFSGCDI